MLWSQAFIPPCNRICDLSTMVFVINYYLQWGQEVLVNACLHLIILYLYWSHYSKHHSRPPCMLQLSVSQFVCGVNRMVILGTGSNTSTKHTAHTAHLVSLHSPLNVAPCGTIFTTCTQQKQSSCFDCLVVTAVASYRSQIYIQM